MITRQRVLQYVLATAVLSLCLPVLAAAQGRNDSWDPQYQNGRYRDSYRYDRNALRDAVRRVKDRSKDFEHSLDHSLDRGRYNGSNREDRINSEAKEFCNAADDLKDKVGNARDLNKSAGQARRLLDIGSRLDRFVSRGNVDGRTMNNWNQIRQDLQYIADAYGFRMDDFGDNYPYRR